MTAITVTWTNLWDCRINVWTRICNLILNSKVDSFWSCIRAAANKRLLFMILGDSSPSRPLKLDQMLADITVVSLSMICKFLPSVNKYPEYIYVCTTLTINLYLALSCSVHTHSQYRASQTPHTIEYSLCCSRSCWGKRLWQNGRI